MRRLLAGTAVLALFSMTQPGQATPALNADATFTRIYQTEWSWRQSQKLAWDHDNPKGVEPQLPAVDAATQQAHLAYWTNIMGQLETVDPKALSAENRLNYAVYKAQIEVKLNELRFRDYEKPLTGDTAFWMDINPSTRDPFKTVADYDNFLSQMKDIPRYFAQEMENMRTGYKRGFTPPRVTLQGRDGSIASVANAKSPQESIFFELFEHFPATIPADQQARLRLAAIDTIDHSVTPSYKRLLQFFDDEYIPHARTTLGANKLPDGDAYYQSKILEFTTTTLTAAQIHQIGLDETAKIHVEMLATMRQTGFKGDFPSFLHFLRTDPRFYAKTPDELLKDAAWIAKEFDGLASRYFGLLPRARFAIEPVPADEAPFYTSGRGGPGVYLVNTYDLPSRALYALPALTLHESAPGHAFQMPIAMENKSLPPFRRAYISAYGEGWAVYCERFGSEMGIYHTPYETFGMLSYQAWRAARLVVDTGIHTQDWTRERAQQYLRDNTALSDHEIETEVDRYISWPGQALSYYLGEMSIWKERHKAEAALGSKFNIRAFHDAVLQLGSVPLPVLEQQMDAFIALGGTGPYPDMER